MASPHDLVAHLKQLRTASPGRGVADEKKPSRAGLATDVDEAEKVERLGPSSALAGTAFSGETTELNQACLLRVKVERELAKPHSELGSDAGRVVLVYTGFTAAQNAELWDRWQ
jgi:hypothetical protein